MIGMYDWEQQGRGKWSGRKSPFKRWFAWHPVRLGLHGRLVWLRFVRRRFITGYYITFTLPFPTRGIRWEYRE